MDPQGSFADCERGARKDSHVQMLELSTYSGPVRWALALLFLAAAALLLLPAAPSQRQVCWDDLIAPLGVGLPVTRGYVLSPPRRGDGHDIAYVARRDPGPTGPAARIEVHVVDRGQWVGVAETPSFGVGWEEPPVGSLVSASRDDMRAVRDTLAEAIARNDSGFPSVDSVALASDSQAPTISRILERLSGTRGMVVGALAALALVLLTSVPYGAIAIGTFLFAIGLSLRAASLDLPFAHDQDVQRLFSGHLPLREIATGSGLMDRHPPLYFFVLHFVEKLGQSEALVRAPAVIAGALAAPAILVATASMRGRVGPLAALAALVVAVSPELLARSREVSEIPLFALIVIAAAASLVAAVRKAGTARLVTVALSHALVLFTYYLGPLILAANAAALLWLRKANRRIMTALAVGAALGGPAVVLGVVTLFRDRGAREVARAFPGLAWGEHSPAQMAAHMGRIAVEALGEPLLALVFVAVVIGVRRRDLAVIMPALGAVVTFAGIALLAPIARVQGYYVTTVLPLAVLALAAVPEPENLRHKVAGLAALVLAIAFSTVPSLSRARALYLPDADAFMPRFASMIAQHPGDSVVTVAHYDKTLLAYYMAQADGRSIGWDNVDVPSKQRIEPLVKVHSLEAGSEQAAASRLERIIAAGPTLVIERDSFLLPSVMERLSTCELLLQAPTGRLVRCTPPGAS